MGECRKLPEVSIGLRLTVRRGGSYSCYSDRTGGF